MNLTVRWDRRGIRRRHAGRRRNRKWPYLAGLSKYHWVSVGAGCQRLPVIGMPLTTFFRLFEVIMYFGMGREIPMLRKLSADRLRKSFIFWRRSSSVTAALTLS